MLLSLINFAPWICIKLTEIGFITDKKEDMYLEAKDGTLVGITAQGWNSLLEE